jgi:hypothetical protein
MYGYCVSCNKYRWLHRTTQLVWDVVSKGLIRAVAHEYCSACIKQVTQPQLITNVPQR